MFPMSLNEESDVDVLDSVGPINRVVLHQEMVIAMKKEWGPINGHDRDQVPKKESTSQHQDAKERTEELYSQVPDLTRTFVARDVELERLCHRCQFLTTLVEHQDALLAKIDATTSGNETEIASTRLPLCSETMSNVRQKEKGTWKNNPSVVEPADQMLEARLDSMGFQGQSIAKAVEARRENKSVQDVVRVDLDEISCVPFQPNSLSANASDCSFSSMRTASSSSSLFGDINCEPVSKSSQSWSSPRSGSIVKRRLSLERQDSGSTEEIFARSAGFLRKSNRTMSARLSVSDLGLLQNDVDVDGDSQLPHETSSNGHGRQEKAGSDQDDSAGFADRGGSSVSTRSHSQRNLFADVDEALKAKTKRKNSDTDPVGEDKTDEDSFTYSQFLQRISQPASRDILDKIRMFVGSISTLR